MNLYQIVKSLQDAKGNLAKQAILDENKDNELLREFMKATYDPAINYYITKVPAAKAEDVADFDLELIQFIVAYIGGRVYTGDAAKGRLKAFSACLNEEGQELLKLLIKRSIGASVGETMVLKTWPDLIFIPPYQRCSLMDDKIKAKFDGLKSFYVQPKLDGSFAYAVKDVASPSEVITRAGSKYPTWFSERLLSEAPEGFVWVGEIEVYKTVDQPASEEVLLSRQEGNGILNSVLQSGNEEEFEGLIFRLTAWDILTVDEFELEYTTVSYKVRLENLYNSYEEYEMPNILPIQTHTVWSVKEAYGIYSQFTQAGLEGAVIKNPAFIWKNGTSKEQVKLKIAFEADYVITGYYEGEGKAKGMLGGVSGATSDGKIQFNCGSGFSDDLRKYLWSIREELPGKIFTAIANDVVSKRDSNVKSLFLPIFSEIREDKKIVKADSYERVMEQLEASKQGV